MNHYEQLINALYDYPSKAWINLYFDLQKRLFEKLELENDDPRLALSLTADNKMPVNLGRRYVLRPLYNNTVRVIVPIDFEEAAIGGTINYTFTKNKIADAKWIELPFEAENPLPQIAWDACLFCCEDILQHCSKSGNRKHHVTLLYDFTMEHAVRNEILNEVNMYV